MKNHNCCCNECGIAFYRKPSEQNTKNFCTRLCYRLNKTKYVFSNLTCPMCKQDFIPLDSNPQRKYCSRLCANKSRRGMKYTGLSCGNQSRKKLALLKNIFNFNNCMVDGCDYCTTYDIHRFVPGSQGGKYEIGNMFAICPNHHAEVSRKIIEFEKISDCKLKIKSSG